MEGLEDFLAAESRALARRLNILRAFGDEIGSCSPADAVTRLDAACAFCDTELLPRLDLHETLVDAFISGVLGGLDVARPLVAERRRLRGLAMAMASRRREGSFDPSCRRALRRELYLLHAVASVYLARQQTLYLPLLRGRMHAAAQDALVHQLTTAAPGPVLDAHRLHDRTLVATAVGRDRVRGSTQDVDANVDR